MKWATALSAALLTSCTEFTSVQSPQRPSAEDILTHPKTELINEIVFERDGLEEAMRAAVTGPDMPMGTATSTAKGFYELCRPGIPYLRHDIDTLSAFTDMDAYPDLSGERRKAVERLVVGAGADMFGCGTIIDLGDFYGQMKKQVEVNHGNVCLPDPPDSYTHGGRLWQYEAAVHQWLDDNPKYVSHDISVGKIIEMALIDRHLCAPSP